MDFDEAYEMIPGNGWLSEDEAELLWMMAALCDGPILEVGCYKGRSTCLLAYLGRQVYAVDPFDEFTTDHDGDQIQRTLLDNLAARDLTNVEVFRQRIEDWQRKTVGFAYLDGDHSYDGTVRQIEIAVACLSGQGTNGIAVHDYNDSGDGLEVKQAAMELLGPPKERAGRLAVWVWDGVVASANERVDKGLRSLTRRRR